MANQPINTLYFWRAEFKDGHIIQEFSPEGKEIRIETFMPPYMKERRENNQRHIGGNVFEEIEKEHGVCIKFGFYPLFGIPSTWVGAIEKETDFKIPRPVTFSMSINPNQYPAFWYERSIEYLGSNKQYRGVVCIALVDRANAKTCIKGENPQWKQEDFHRFEFDYPGSKMWL
jgi:hypothetical protein